MSEVECKTNQGKIAREKSKIRPEGKECKIPPRKKKAKAKRKRRRKGKRANEKGQTVLTTAEKGWKREPSKKEQMSMRTGNFSNGIADSPKGKAKKRAGLSRSRSLKRGESLTGLTGLIIADSPKGNTKKGDSLSRSLTRSHTVLSREESFRSVKKIGLEERVDLVEHALGRVIFTHTGMSLDAAFAYFDKSRTSELDKSEIKHILNQTNTNFTEEELQLLMDRLDEDGNGGISIHEFERNYRVKRDLLLNFVKAKEECRLNFAELPVIFIFFVCFVLLLAGHDLTSTKYTASRGILAGALNPAGGGNTLSSLKSPDRIWNWLEKEFMEYAFVQEDLSGNPLPKKDWGYISNYNKFLGPGVHLSQVRSVSEECRISQINDAFGHKCFPTYKLSSKKFGSVYDNFTAFNPDSGSSHSSHKQFTALLDYKLPQAELKHTIQTLRKNNWIDKSTAWLDVKYVVMNMESYGTYTTVTLEFEFSRGGRVIPSFNAESLLVNPYVGYNIGWAVLDFVWIAFQIYTAVREGKNLCEVGWKEYTHGPAGAWNVLDWVQIAVTLAVAGLWFTMVGYLANLLVEADNGANPVDFVDTIELIVRYNVWYKLLSIVNLFILLLRFFKGFSAQPRLRILVDAIVGAAVDLAHWFIIFISLLLTFVMCAMFLFGHRTEDFSDIPKGLFYAFRGWIAPNAIPYVGFFETDPSFTIIWFLLFCFLMIFVVQKMVLAIVLMSFVKTRNAHKDARTLRSQISDFCADVKAQTENLMTLSGVISLIDKQQFKMHSDDRINVNMLVQSYFLRKELTPKQESYCQKLCVSLMREFFESFDKMRAPDMHVRSTNAYARIQQLDEDFTDFNKRLALIEAHADEVLKTIRAKYYSSTAKPSCASPKAIGVSKNDSSTAKPSYATPKAIGVSKNIEV